MTFNAQNFLDQHDGDALKALEALATKRDEEGKDAARARRQRDEAKQERDALKDQLTDLEKRAVPEGATVLTGADATAWQTFTERGGLTAFDEADEAKKERDALKRDRDLDSAAKVLNKPKDALAEILEGKTLTAQKGKAEDGTEVDVWGIGEGDAFKPLSDLKAVQYLASEPTAPPKTAPAPLPLGGAGGKPQPKTADQIAAEKRSRAEYSI